MKDYRIIIISLLIIFLFVLALLFLFVVKEEKVPYCGDNVCETGETYETCPQDCESTQIKQGIKGKVTLYQGNCMPPAGVECIINNISTTIKIYDLLPKEQILDNYYIGDRTPVVVVTSSQDGVYKIGLPNGQYSILVEDPINESMEYCNVFDNTYACPVTINNDLVEFNIKIDHAEW
jgi:hypothetical protein